MECTNSSSSSPNAAPIFLENITKNDLLKYHNQNIRYWEDKLPEHLKNDPEVQQYFYCKQHLVNQHPNDPTYTQLDLSSLIRNQCLYCMKDKIIRAEEKMDVDEGADEVVSRNTIEDETQGGRCDCECDCWIN